MFNHGSGSVETQTVQRVAVALSMLALALVPAGAGAHEVVLIPAASGEEIFPVVTPGDHLVISTSGLDFGLIGVGDFLYGRVQVSNTSERDVVLNVILEDDSLTELTVFELVGEAQVALPAGGSHEILIRYSPNFAGFDHQGSLVLQVTHDGVASAWTESGSDVVSKTTAAPAGTIALSGAGRSASGSEQKWCVDEEVQRWNSGNADDRSRMTITARGAWGWGASGPTFFDDTNWGHPPFTPNPFRHWIETRFEGTCNCRRGCSQEAIATFQIIDQETLVADAHTHELDAMSPVPLPLGAGSGFVHEPGSIVNKTLFPQGVTRKDADVEGAYASDAVAQPWERCPGVGLLSLCNLASIQVSATAGFGGESPISAEAGVQITMDVDNESKAIVGVGSYECPPCTRAYNVEVKVINADASISERVPVTLEAEDSGSLSPIDTFELPVGSDGSMPEHHVWLDPSHRSQPLLLPNGTRVRATAKATNGNCTEVSSEAVISSGVAKLTLDCCRAGQSGEGCQAPQKGVEVRSTGSYNGGQATVELRVQEPDKDPVIERLIFSKRETKSFKRTVPQVSGTTWQVNLIQQQCLSCGLSAESDGSNGGPIKQRLHCQADTTGTCGHRVRAEVSGDILTADLALKAKLPDGDATDKFSIRPGEKKAFQLRLPDQTEFQVASTGAISKNFAEPVASCTGASGTIKGADHEVQIDCRTMAASPCDRDRWGSDCLDEEHEVVETMSGRGQGGDGCTLTPIFTEESRSTTAWVCRPDPANAGEEICAWEEHVEIIGVTRTTMDCSDDIFNGGGFLVAPGIPLKASGGVSTLPFVSATGPAVGLTAPPEPMFREGTLWGVIRSESPIRRIVPVVDGEQVALEGFKIDPDGTFSGILDVRGLADGVHRFGLLVWNEEPMFAFPGIAFEVDNNRLPEACATDDGAPQLAVSPDNDAVVEPGPVQVSGTTTDVSPTTTTVKVDGTAVGSFTTSSWSLAHDFTAGAHLLEVVASDTCGWKTVLLHELEAASGPRMRVETAGQPVGEQLDWGVVDFRRSSTANRQITVKSVGSESLVWSAEVVANTAAQGGFFLAGTQVSPLASGSSDNFTLKLNTGHAGSFTADLSIAHNDEAASPLTVALRGTVKSPPVMSVRYNSAPSTSGETRDFGNHFSNSGTKARSVTLTNTAPNTASVLFVDSVEVTNAGTAAVFSQGGSPPSQLVPGSDGHFNVQADTGHPAGTYSGQLLIHSTDPGSPHVIHLRITIDPQPPELELAADGAAIGPTRIDWFEIDYRPGTVVGKQITVRNAAAAGASSLAWKATIPENPTNTTANGGFFLQGTQVSPLAAGAADNFTVSLNPGHVGTFSQTLRITHDAGNVATPWSRQLKGTVKAPPSISVTYNSFPSTSGETRSFGSHPPNSGVKARNIGLSNTAANTASVLFVDSLEVVHDGGASIFSTGGNPPAELGPGAADGFNVQADTNGQSPGTYTGRLLIHTNDPGSPHVIHLEIEIK